MDDLAHIVEQHCGHENLSRLFLLLVNHGVKATDGVILQAGHGAAAIQNKYDLRQILLHNKTSCNALFELTTTL